MKSSVSLEFSWGVWSFLREKPWDYTSLKMGICGYMNKQLENICFTFGNTYVESVNNSEAWAGRFSLYWTQEADWRVINHVVERPYIPYLILIY